jgi:hypothetical protein
MVTCKTPGPAATSCATAPTTYLGVTMADLEGFEERYPLNSAGDRTAGWSRRLPRGRTLRPRADRVVRHVEAAILSATPRGARALVGIAPARSDRVAYDIAGGTNTPVDTITASSRSTSTPAASRAPGRAWSTT